MLNNTMIVLRTMGAVISAVLCAVFFGYVLIFVLLLDWLPAMVAQTAKDIDDWMLFGNPTQDIVLLGGVVGSFLLSWLTIKVNDNDRPVIQTLIALVWILAFIAWALLLKVTAY